MVNRAHSPATSCCGRPEASVTTRTWDLRILILAPICLRHVVWLTQQGRHLHRGIPELYRPNGMPESRFPSTAKTVASSLFIYVHIKSHLLMACDSAQTDMGRGCKLAVLPRTLPDGSLGFAANRYKDLAESADDVKRQCVNTGMGFGGWALISKLCERRASSSGFSLGVNSSFVRENRHRVKYHCRFISGWLAIRQLCYRTDSRRKGACCRQKRIPLR